MKRVIGLCLLFCGCTFTRVEPFFFNDAGAFFTFDGGTGDGGDCLAATDDNPVLEKAMPPAISGGTMAAMADGTLVIGDADRDVVWLVAGHGASIRSLALTAGDEPGRVTEGEPGVAYVALRRANQLLRVDVAAGTFTRADTCQAPRAVVYRPTAHNVLVGCASGVIMRHQGQTASPLPLRSSLEDLRDLVLTGEDTLLATSFRSARVSLLTISTGTAADVPHTSLPFEGTPSVAWRAIKTPSGALMSYQLATTLPLPPVKGVCGGYGGLGPSGENSGPLVLSAVAGIDSRQVAQPAELMRYTLPVDLAVNGGQVGLVSAGAKMVALLSASSLHLPEADAGVPDGGGFFSPEVLLSGAPVAIAASGDGFAVFEREPAAVVFVTSDGHSSEVPLPGVSVASTGHDLFHTATFSNIACASCHPEAGDDGRVWAFFEGARRTPSLRGGLTGTAPFHWSGDEANIDALMDDVMTHRMAGPRETPERTAALLRWLDAQKALPARVSDAAMVARGQVLFESAQTGCASCHTGPLGTNNATVDVGTGGAFQVPRLVELGWRADWFHDGRVHVPADRFTPAAGGEAHGHLSQLSLTERADLTAYLRSR